jgi:predicted ester cyclase
MPNVSAIQLKQIKKEIQMSVQTNLKVAREIYDAFNKKDFSHSQKLIDNNAQFQLMPFSMKLSGIDGYLQMVQGWASTFPDVYCDIKNIAAGEDSVVCEFIGKGTQTGPLMLPEGTIMPTGKKVEVAFCEVMKINNGKVISLNSYFDTGTMMHQLGLLPESKHQ